MPELTEVERPAPVVADAGGQPEIVAEAGPLGSEMASAYRRYVEVYREHFRLSPQDAVAKADQPTHPDHEKRILDGPHDQVSWLDLHTLADRDPELAARRWDEIKGAARDELLSGYRAATAMESSHHQAWQRAQFLAVRDTLAREWQPRSGVEWTLIDVMAQAHTSYLFWHQRLVMMSVLESENDAIKNKECWKPPRVDDAQAIDQAAAMVDRFNRVFTRALRALRDLRRYSPLVVVQNAGQVNVAEQQMNVTSDRKVLDG